MKGLISAHHLSSTEGTVTCASSASRLLQPVRAEASSGGHRLRCDRPQWPEPAAGLAAATDPRSWAGAGDRGGVGAPWPGRPSDRRGTRLLSSCALRWPPPWCGALCRVANMLEVILESALAAYWEDIVDSTDCNAWVSLGGLSDVCHTSDVGRLASMTLVTLLVWVNVTGCTLGA